MLCDFAPMRPGCLRGPYLVVMSGRLLRSLVFFMFLAGVGVLSLADRAPGAAERAVDFGQRAGSFGERSVGLDLIDRGDVPFAFDTVGHFVLWAGAGVLGYVAFGRRTSATFITVSLITLSAGVEVGQGLLSSTRHPGLTDLIANAVGVSVGVGVAVFVWAMSRQFGRLTRTLTG